MTGPATPAPSTVTLPGVGPVRRSVVIVGVIALGVLAYVIYKKRTASAAAAVTGVNTTTGTAALPDTGYVNPAPTSPSSGPIDQSTPGVITSNDQWSQTAIQDLTANGWNAQFAATTIGRYISGQQLSQEEADAVRAAYGLAGYPPTMVALVTAPTGSSGSGTGTTGGTPGGTTTVTVNEGDHVSPLLTNGVTVAQLQALNPGLNIAQANGNGYISPSNPDTGNSVPVFNVVHPTTITVPTP